DLRELLRGAALPPQAEHDYPTAAGMVIANLGRIPNAGEHSGFEDWRIEELDLDGPRSDKLQLQRIAVEDRDGYDCTRPQAGARRLHCWRPRRNPAPAGAAGRPGTARLRDAAVHRHAAGLHSHPDRRRDQRAAGGADRPAIAVGPAPAVAAAVHRHAWPATALAGPFRPPGIAMAGTTGAPGAPAPARGPALPGVAP